MAVFHGIDGEVRLSENAVGEVQNWSLDHSAEIAERYSMGDEYKRREAGVKDWSGSCECLFDSEDAAQIAADPGMKFDIYLVPKKGSGNPEFSGRAVIDSVAVSSPKDGFTAKTINFSGDGALSEGVIQ